MKGKQMTGCWAKFTVFFSALLPVSRPAVLRKKGHGAMKWWFHQHRLSFTHTTRRLSATYLPSRPLVAPPPFICTASSFFFPFSQIVCSSTHRKILIARAIWRYLSSLPFFLCVCVSPFFFFFSLSRLMRHRDCVLLCRLCVVLRRRYTTQQFRSIRTIKHLPRLISAGDRGEKRIKEGPWCWARTFVLFYFIFSLDSLRRKRIWRPFSHSSGNIALLR